MPASIRYMFAILRPNMVLNYLLCPFLSRRCYLPRRACSLCTYTSGLLPIRELLRYSSLCAIVAVTELARCYVFAERATILRICARRESERRRRESRRSESLLAVSRKSLATLAADSHASSSSRRLRALSLCALLSNCASCRDRTCRLYTLLPYRSGHG